MGRASGRAAIAGCVALALVFAACALAWKPLGPRRTAPIADAEAIGADECKTCHGDVSGHEQMASFHRDCETCHGPGSVHAESEAKKDIRFPSTADCLTCHAPGRDTHLSWGSGEHSRAGLLCSDCHALHDNTRQLLRTAPATALAPRRTGVKGLDEASRLCTSCHEDIAARLTMPSHHPVQEGMMSCTSCHDPHEDRRVTAGGGDPRCASCHQDHMGPWVYEHLPVAERCDTCHDPHGAPAPKLLATPQPVICLSCHSLADLWHHNTSGTGVRGNTGATQDFPPAGSGQAVGSLEARTFLRNCTNCHGAIHGSFSDSTLQK